MGLDIFVSECYKHLDWNHYTLLLINNVRRVYKIKQKKTDKADKNNNTADDIFYSQLFFL